MAYERIEAKEMNRQEFDALSLDERMRIMKFFQSARNRWKRFYNKELSLETYLSWLESPNKDLDPTTQKSKSGGVEIDEIPEKVTS